MAMFPKSKLALELSLKRELDREKEKLQQHTEELVQPVGKLQRQFQEDEDIDVNVDVDEEESNQNNDNQNDNGSSGSIVTDNDELEASVVASLNNAKQEEQETPDNDDYMVSPIVDFATTRPIEIINDFDLNIRIEKKYYYEPDSRLIDDKMLVELCEKHPDIKYLNLGNCDKIMDFSPIAKLKNLEQLDLNNCDYLYDIDFLKTCMKLKVLNIADTDIKYIDVIKYLPELVVLNLSTNPVQDLRPLYNCKKLKDLVLWGCLSLEDVSALRYCTSLRVLDIDSVPVSDLSCLENLPSLDTLLMDNCNNITDFSFLRKLVTLKILACDGTVPISTDNLQNFSNLTNLVYLTLNNRRISNLAPLKNLINLRELQLKSNIIIDLTPLTNMVNMLKIDLSNNSNLTDLNPLYKMANLTSFKMEGNTASALAVNGSKKSITANMIVENFEVVKNFPELKAFYINGNYKVKDLSPLRYCTKLEELSVTHCMQLEVVEFVRYLEQIFLLFLNDNPRIKDLYCVTKLTKLRQFNYRGTAVPTAKMTNILKRCSSIFDLSGNNNNRIQGQYIASAKKRCKLYSLRKKIKK